MSLQSAVIITKGACMTYIPFASGLAGFLALQTDMPTIGGIKTTLISGVLSASVAGIAGLSGWMSQSFGNWLKGANGNGGSDAK